MKKLLILIITIAHGFILQAQDMQIYYALIEKARQSHTEEMYAQAVKEYEAAFASLGNKGIPADRFDAAIVMAKAKEKKKAFDQLFRLAEHELTKYRDLEALENVNDFEILRSDRRWDKLIEIVSSNKEFYEKDFDEALATELENMYKLDQKYRLQVPEVEKEHGFESPEMKELVSAMKTTDTDNLARVIQILEEHGWLGPQIVGKAGNNALFHIIQHAELTIQLKYLPMMRDAVAKDNAYPHQLALLEDRINVRQGKKQTFGSQIGRNPHTGEYYVEPIRDPERVNEFRKSVGLPSLETYLSQWNILWDVQKHKQRISETKATN
ncbi:MAG: hypothetical protein HRT61_18535 [Ekhidna sp.]|nr:hypothetical protein [Ekhidna sp.]